MTALAYRPEPWTEQGICRTVDPDVWFPEVGCGRPAVQTAVKICQGCPVRRECLAAALERNERFGIWGGTTERQRRGMREAK